MGRHPLGKELLRRVEDNAADPVAKDIAVMMFNTATLRSGFPLRDTTTNFAGAIETMTRKSMTMKRRRKTRRKRMRRLRRKLQLIPRMNYRSLPCLHSAASVTTNLRLCDNNGQWKLTDSTYSGIFKA